MVYQLLLLKTLVASSPVPFHCLLVLLGTYVYCYICTSYVLLTAHPEDISLP